MAKQLTDVQVVEIRDKHLWLRQVRDGAPESERDTDGEIDAQVAEEFGISRTHVASLVEGRSRPAAGGPIDHRRVQIQHLYAEESKVLDAAEAARRRRLRIRGIDPDPKAIRYVQRVTVLDAHGRDTNLSTVLEPGQSLRVDLVAEGGRP